MVVVNHSRKEIIVAIRGTLSVPDAVTDLDGTNTPFMVCNFSDRAQMKENSKIARKTT